MTSSSIVGVLLAGGRSSRFGGGDKCLLSLGGTPILARAVARLGPQVGRLMLNANGDRSRFQAFGLPVVADLEAAGVEEFAGPLAGVLAGLAAARGMAPKAKAIVTAAADTPFFPRDLVARLAAASGGERLAVAKSETGVHPVFGLWPLALEGDLRRDLQAGKRKASAWARAHGAIEVDFAPERLGAAAVDPFFNINRPEDLAEAEALLAGAR
jgi:molybdopterin-guanine dinucleotide biosynthesis protein A